VVGRICHINARSAGGPRFDQDQSEADRRSFENLLLMCPTHHDVIDDDPEAYTVERLIKIKQGHESKAAAVEPLEDEAASAFIAGDVFDSVVTINQSGGQNASTIINIAAVPAAPSSNESPEQILTRLQDATVGLGKTLSEALSFARRSGLDSLATFCTSELGGYQGTLDKRDPDFPGYRVIESYCSITAELNTQYIGFGQSAAVAMRFLRSSGDFARFDYFVANDIQTIERRAADARSKNNQLLSWSIPYGQLLGAKASGDIPTNHPVQFYAAGPSYQRVLDGVRAELTRRLLACLKQK
jgi:hypothetical protein